MLPIICFAIASGGLPVFPEWQSGRLHECVALLMSPRAAWPLFPLLAFSMIAMTALCVAPVTLAFKRFIKDFDNLAASIYDDAR